MKYFDLHCDTLTASYDKGESILHSSCDISLDLTSDFERYTQVLAVWSDPKYTSDELYERFFSVISRFKKSTLPENFSYMLAVEGGTLIGNDVSRIDRLFATGVRIFTPLWKGVTQLGGAFGENIGLTELGRRAIERCFELGIIVDLSHASDKSFYDIYSLSEKKTVPIIASHSNSRTVCDHARNLTDEMAEIIIKSGGLIGISLYPPHLSSSGKAELDDICRHVEHYLSLGGESCLCTGFDLDGTDGDLPREISKINDVGKIHTRICKAFSDKIANAVFFENANNFFGRNGILPQK